jgi:hypothetical protein
VPTVSADVLEMAMPVSNPAWFVTNGKSKVVVVAPAGRIGGHGVGVGSEWCPLAEAGEAKIVATARTRSVVNAHFLGDRARSGISERVEKMEACFVFMVVSGVFELLTAVSPTSQFRLANIDWRNGCDCEPAPNNVDLYYRSTGRDRVCNDVAPRLTANIKLTLPNESLPSASNQIRFVFAPPNLGGECDDPNEGSSHGPGPKCSRARERSGAKQESVFRAATGKCIRRRRLVSSYWLSAFGVLSDKIARQAGRELTFFWEGECCQSVRSGWS